MPVNCASRYPTNVRFSSFWPGFDPHDFFIPFLERSIGTPIRLVSRSLDADIEVFSSAGRDSFMRRTRLGRWLTSDQQGPRRSQALRIHYTGEPVAPPFGVADLTLSFDLDEYDASNAYLPLIYLSADESVGAVSEASMRRGTSVSIQAATRSRGIGDTPARTGFVCAFLRNPEPTRLRAISMLQEVGEVDVFGPLTQKPVVSKFAVASKYRYMLCFENSPRPGYITEKPLDAWAAGCVPLWRGLDPASVLNPKALINLLDFTDLRGFVEFVARTEPDPVSRTVSVG